MPRLNNDRNELYARHRAKGMLPSKAALAAGYAAGSSTTHLEQDPEVVARIGELMDEMRAQRDSQRAAAVEAAKVVGSLTGVGRAWVIQQLAEVAQVAKQDGDYKSANQALELIGKDFGMFSGGSADEGGGNVPRTLDLDALNSVLDQTTAELPGPVVDESRVFDDDTALRLIEGQASPELLRRARRLSTGSETDVALMELDELPDETAEQPTTDAEREDFDAIRAAQEDF